MSLRIIVFHPTCRRYTATYEHTVVCEETPIYKVAKEAADKFRDYLKNQGKQGKVRLEVRLVDAQGVIKKSRILEEY